MQGVAVLFYLSLWIVKLVAGAGRAGGLFAVLGLLGFGLMGGQNLGQGKEK